MLSANRPMVAKVKTITDMLALMDASGIHSSLELEGKYRKFVASFSDVGKPLNEQA